MSRGRVLLTGASGFIGRHCLPGLLAMGFEVHAVARHPVPETPPMVTWHPVDLMDAAAVQALADQVRATHLLHLAWTVTPGQFWRAPENLDWVAASLLLYRAFVQAGGRRVLVAGSCAEYDWGYDLLDEATTPCRPATLYGVSKHALHQLLAAAAHQDGVALAWGRLFFLFGPHEAPGRLVPDVARALLRGAPAPCGDGRAERDFMAVQDAAAALVAILASEHVGPVNVASGRCVPIREVIQRIADLVGRPDLVQWGARLPPAGEPARLAAGTSVLHDAIGFRQAQSLEASLPAAVAWWLE